LHHQSVPGRLSRPEPTVPVVHARHNVRERPGVGRRFGTTVTFGGNVGQVVWVEEPYLHGARVSLAGTLLDSLPIDISGPDFQMSSNAKPQVAWSGRNFMVVWTSSNRAVFALVTPDGQVAQRTMLHDSTPDYLGAAVGFDGTSFLASWIGLTADYLYRAFFTRITFGGVVLDSPPKLVAAGNQSQQRVVAVRFHDDRYLVVWSAYEAPYDLWGSFILPDGSVPDSVGFPIRPGVSTSYPSVTHDRENYVVAWYEFNGIGTKLKLARVTDDGQVLDTSGVLIDSFRFGTSAIFSTGDTTLVVFCSDSLWYGDSISVMAVRLDTALRRLDSMPVVIGPPGPGGKEGFPPSDPSVALSGNDYFVAWCQPFSVSTTPYNTNAVFRRLARSGQIVDSAAVVVSLGINRHSYPDVASDGTDFLAVWIDTRHDSVERSEAVCGMRFSRDGTRLDPAGFRISPPDATRPALAFGAGCYLVCWVHEEDVYGARVMPDGSLLDSVPIAIEHDSTRTAYTPDVAFGDSSFLVVWRAGDMVYGVRVRPDGVVADTAPKAMQPHPVYSARYPQVAFDGRNFLVVRNEHGDDFYAARVSTNEELLDSIDLVFGSPSSSSSVPELAFGGGVYLVVDSRGNEIWRISQEGIVLDSAIATAGSRFSVAFDGTNFLLPCRGDTTTEVGGLRIAPDGRVLDSLPFVLSMTEGSSVSSYTHAVATDGAGKLGLVVRATEPAPYDAGRIRAATFPAIGIRAGHEDVPVAQFRALPNPASRMVSLSFGLRQAGPVQVSAFDAAGRRCAVVHSGRMTAGTHRLTFDTRRLANGVYFLRFEAGTDRSSSRLVVSH
jgi:hypothetical protein